MKVDFLSPMIYVLNNVFLESVMPRNPLETPTSKPLKTTVSNTKTWKENI